MPPNSLLIILIVQHKDYMTSSFDVVCALPALLCNEVLHVKRGLGWV